MAGDVELLAEQQHLRHARVCLVQMRESAERIADYGVDALASEALGRLRAQRLAQLSGAESAPPFFGRTDRDLPSATDRDGQPVTDRNGQPATDRDGQPATAEVLHIGRRHIRDDAGDPMVIDWRAPLARPFYRATPADRQGVQLRRRFGFAEGDLSSYEDERLDRGQATGADSAVLKEEIERPRVGPMRDIVATIQPDQDDLVRAGLETSLCIQGAPGTGKTAVGLHRAAYLLYTYPERLRRSGVLVVGPNSAFLRYIAQVLPALGEDGITQATVEELVARTLIRAMDEPAVAVLKGDAIMAEILRRAVFSHVGKPVDDVLAVVGTKRYRVSRDRLRRYVDDARRYCVTGELRWDSARDRLRSLVAQDVRRQREDAGGAPSDTETAKVARSAGVKEFLDSAWPVLEPKALLCRLFTEPEFLGACAGQLSPEQQAMLTWPAPPRSVRAATFSAADQVLLDELSGLLNAPDSYVHVVLDEAQDLSAMQCRAVARRCPTGSMTVLGDLAQATTAWAPGSWPATCGHLARPDAQVRPLTVGYRVPEEVLAVANRLLPHIAPEVPPATSIRAGADALTVAPDVLTATTRCLGQPGSVAVIVADAQVTAVLAQLTQAGISAARLDSEDEEPARVTVLGARQAKGLEFDSVVLIEPGEIVAAELTRLAGLRRLYVAWTRAVSRLVLVHSAPLPAELD